MSYRLKRSTLSTIFTLAVVACVGAVLVPSTLRAQQSDALREATSPLGAVAAPASVAPRDATPTVPVGPRDERAGIDTRASADQPLDAPQRGGSHLGAGSNIALMGAGAAALIVGLMIGGDGGTIIAISGGVIGLVGLFRYIR